MLKNRFIHSIFLIFIFLCSFRPSLHCDLPESFIHEAKIAIPSDSNTKDKKIFKSHQLQQSHPLYNYLDSLFYDPNMFKTPKQFEDAGFNLIFGHKKLMVGAHPSFPEYLFKKFPNSCSQSQQLQNFILRIKGAEILRKYIISHQFKHIVVPQKWLCKLPKSFSNENQDTYILIVENMDIVGGGDNPDGATRQAYLNIDKEMLTELCMILHDVGGCDAWPRNLPFTSSGKIAFVDTEHVGRKKGDFVKHIIPVLNPQMQEYAWALWRHLESNSK